MFDKEDNTLLLGVVSNAQDDLSNTEKHRRALIDAYPQGRKIGTLSEQETMVAYLAHEWVEKRYHKTGIMQFLDIRKCQPAFSLAYIEIPPPLHSWRCIFELSDNRLVHVIVSERPIQLAVEFMWDELSPVARAAVAEHENIWHEKRAG